MFQALPLYDAMFTALVQDRVDFIQLFLENGVSLKNFLSIATLWNLYANVCVCGSYSLKISLLGFLKSFVSESLNYQTNYVSQLCLSPWIWISQMMWKKLKKTICILWMLNYQKPIWFLKCEVTKKVVHNYIIMKYLKRLVSI